VAAIGRAQLQVLDKRVETKRAIFDHYQEALGGLPGIDFMPEIDSGRSSRWLTIMTLDQVQTGIGPMELIEALENENIEARPVWKPMHRQPLFAACPYFPHAEGLSMGDSLFAKGVCLPSGSQMTTEQQERVIECIRSALK